MISERFASAKRHNRAVPEITREEAQDLAARARAQRKRADPAMRAMAEEVAAMAVADVAADGYSELERVLALAYDQASCGKGEERHATVRGVAAPFHEQPIMSIQAMVGPGFAAGQAMKKLHEAMELPDDRALAEVLGAVVYCCAVYLAIERGVRR